MRERLEVVRDERGTTLIEISVTMILLGIVMTMFMTFVSSIQTAVGRQEARVERNNDVRLALAQLDREIRSGNVFYDPVNESSVAGDVVPDMAMRVYTQADAPNRNPGSQCAQWRITSGGEMQTRRWSTTGANGAVVNGSVTEWWTVARNIVNRSLSPPVPAFDLDTTTTAYGKRIMKIRLVVDRPGDQAAPQEVGLSITGRNTQYSYPTDICGVVPAY